MRRPSGTISLTISVRAASLALWRDLPPAPPQGFQQARIAADLTQLQQRVDHRDGVLAQPLAAGGQRRAHRLVHRQADGLVQVALVAVEVDSHHHLGLGRQLLRHRLLGAAEQEGADAAHQQVGAGVVAALLDGHAVTLAEILAVAQQPRHQEGELAPQLAQIVLHRRAGQAEPVPRRQRRHRAGRLAVGVLDRLRLVQHDHVPGQPFQEIDVARHHAIGGDDDVGAVDVGQLAVAVDAMQHHHPQMRGEAFRFRHPVGHEAGRHHHHAGLGQPPLMLLHRDVGQRLGGLAQPHVIGQDAGDVVGAQALHPGEAGTLVVAQLPLEARRRGHVARHLVGAQALEIAVDLRRLVAAPGDQVVDVQQGVGLGQRHLQPVAAAAPAVQHRLQHAEQPLDPFGRQGQDVAVVQHDMGAAVDDAGGRQAALLHQPGQDGQQRLALQHDEHGPDRQRDQDHAERQVHIEGYAERHAEQAGMRDRRAEIGHASPYDETAERRRNDGDAETGNERTKQKGLHHGGDFWSPPGSL